MATTEPVAVRRLHAQLAAYDLPGLRAVAQVLPRVAGAVRCAGGAELMAANTIDWHGPRRQPCPACGRNDRDKTLGMTLNDDGSGVAHCFRCEYVETLRDDRPSAKHAPMRLAAPVRREPAPALSNDWRDFFARLEPVSGPALAYLQARCCVIPPADGDLRWHSNLRHPSGHTGPALVAKVTDALTREPLTLHRTWVQAGGTKAPVDPPRLLLRGYRKAGGVIRLWPDDAITTGLAVAEGIETALALAHAYRPAWACIDAGNLAALPVLGGIESLLIAADHDDAGIEAAQACAARWAAAGCEVHIAMPEQRKTDFNDVAAAS